MQVIGSFFNYPMKFVVLSDREDYYIGIYASDVQTHLTLLSDKGKENFYKDHNVYVVGDEQIYAKHYSKLMLQYLYHNPWEHLRFIDQEHHEGYVSKCFSHVYDSMTLELFAFGETIDSAKQGLTSIIEHLNSDYDQEKVELYVDAIDI